MNQNLIELEHITKSYDGDVILDDLNLSVKPNSFVTLLGPSGCGKTTTLRIIGGFEGHHKPSSQQAPAEHRIPEVRPVPAHEHLREYRFRLKDQE